MATPVAKVAYGGTEYRGKGAVGPMGVVSLGWGVAAVVSLRC